MGAAPREANGQRHSRLWWQKPRNNRQLLSSKRIHKLRGIPAGAPGEMRGPARRRPTDEHKRVALTRTCRAGGLRRAGLTEAAVHPAHVRPPAGPLVSGPLLSLHRAVRGLSGRDVFWDLRCRIDSGRDRKMETNKHNTPGGEEKIKAPKGQRRCPSRGEGPLSPTHHSVPAGHRGAPPCLLPDLLSKPGCAWGGETAGVPRALGDSPAGGGPQTPPRLEPGARPDAPSREHRQVCVHPCDTAGRAGRPLRGRRGGDAPPQLCWGPHIRQHHLGVPVRTWPEDTGLGSWAGLPFQASWGAPWGFRSTAPRTGCGPQDSPGCGHSWPRSTRTPAGSVPGAPRAEALSRTRDRSFHRRLCPPKGQVTRGLPWAWDGVRG
ncbi:uncharacterized protein LOC119517213 [Choloepus didactylus]|uniref:uncharacterized protein LOC119517213 n=1 Tax=Choloepus didactylus TaxID=27675 RepID=UPI00189CC607|nr:uncharacterized protein LOC119517213 [Choloepus didactylus]